MKPGGDISQVGDVLFSDADGEAREDYTPSPLVLLGVGYSVGGDDRLRSGSSRREVTGPQTSIILHLHDGKFWNCFRGSD